MIKMSSLNRAPRLIYKDLVTQEDDSVYATKPCSIYVPKKWNNTKLVSLDERFFVVAILMIKIGNNYSNLNVAGVIELGQCEYETTLIDDVECIEFHYEAGEIVIQNLNAVVDNTLPYYITNIITKNGSIVPYLSYDEFVRIPESFPKYSNLSIPNQAYAILYMSYVCRSIEDKRKRASLSAKGDYVNIPLSSVQLAVENTMNKYSGGYLDEGIQSSIMHPSNKASMPEIIMRS